MNPRGARRRIFGAAVAAALSLAMVVPPVTADDRQGIVVIEGTVLPTLGIIINGGTVAFGDLRPDGTDTASADGAAGESGACYVAIHAVDFEIKSNEDYDGRVSAVTVEDGATPHTAGLAIQDLMWTDDPPGFGPADYADCAAGNAINGAWHNGGPTAGDRFRNEYALNVDWEDESGNINIQVTYSVSQFGIIIDGG